MVPNRVCPICGSVLVHELKQLRQDDEPATLVVGCPVHGSAAELAIRFRSNARHSDLIRQPSIRRHTVPVEDRSVLPQITSVTLLSEVYAMCIMVTGDFDSQERHYRVANIRCLLGNRMIHAQFHSDNPLWCNSKGNTICTMQSIRSLTDPHAIYYKVSRYSSSDVHERTDGTTYMGAYATMLDLPNKVSIVLIRTSQMPCIYSAWFICEHTDQSTAINAITSSLKRSLGSGILRNCDIVADTNIKRWHRQANYMKHDRHTCIIYVPRDVLLPHANGKFIDGNGSYIHYYLCRQICYVLNPKKGIIKYIAQPSINVNVAHPIIISGYKEPKINSMQIISCMDSISGAVCNDVMRDLVEHSDCFVYPIEGSVAQWRSFVPSGQSIVKFRAVPQSDTRIDATPDILHYIISSSLHEFIVDTNQDIMFIYGVPRKEYDLLVHVCRVCWIHDFDWDDENIADFTIYNSVNDAVQRCAKFQANVCNSDEWLVHLQYNNCLVCMLNEIPDADYNSVLYQYVTLDKFIICTNTRNHRFITDLFTQCIIIDLDTACSPNVIPAINAILVSPAPVSYKHIIVSHSICSYIKPRV
jgi:hypothetical protein